MELESGDPACRRLFHGEDGAPNEDSDMENGAPDEDSDSEEMAEEAASFMSAGDDLEPDKALECLDEMLGNVDKHVRQWVMENDCFKTDEIDEIIQNRTKQLNATTMPLCNAGSSTPSSVRQKTRRGCFTQRRLSSASATN